MNIELKPIAESKVRQLGGDVCGVLVRDGGGTVMAVSEHGRCTRLDTGVMGPVDGAQDGEWLIQMRGDYLVTRGVWECPDHRGYTNDINEAGRYSEEEAKEAERMMPEKCKAVRLPTARAKSGQGVVAELVRLDEYRNDILWHKDLNNLPAGTKLHTNPQPARQGSVTEGWKLVPVEPTATMISAFEHAPCAENYTDAATWAWEAMLDATPQPPQEGEGDEH